MEKLALKLPKNLPPKPGVYIFKNKDGVVLYVGKAKNLKNRVGQYFSGSDERPQIPYLMQEASALDFTVVKTELESLYLEQTLIQKYHPKYNILQKDDKSFAYIVFDYKTQIPQITISRNLAENNSQTTKKTAQPLPHSPLTIGGKGRIKSSIHALPAGRLNLKSSNFFGPYSAAYKAKEILKTVRYIFSFCAAEKVGQKPCFYFHLHRCPGVCVGQISLFEYQEHLNKIKKFLSGDIAGAKKEIETEMKAASAKKLFEKAARLRNQLYALNITQQKQNVIMKEKVSWDLAAQFSQDGQTAFSLLKVREGKLSDKENFIYTNSTASIHNPALSPLSLRGEEEGLNLKTEEAGFLQRFLEDYYSSASNLPKTIYLRQKPENGDLIENLLQIRSGKNIRVVSNPKKQALSLLKIAEENAQEFLKQKQSSEAFMLDKINQGLLQIKQVLDLEKTPKRIECYDISNIQGTNAVGSMVVFENGQPKKSEYRKFKIRGLKTPDDFEMMREMLARRLQRSIDDKSQITDYKLQTNPKSEKVNSKTDSPGSATPSLPKRGQGEFWPLPDLIVIDGGKGQLNAAISIIHNSKFNIPTIGLAKRIEEIFLPEKQKPIILSHDQPGLQLLQRLRDETHRFGITFHRQLRSKQAVRSALDDIKGIGPKTKKLLKQKFGTVSEIKKAPFEALSEVVGSKLAEIIKQEL